MNIRVSQLREYGVGCYPIVRTREHSSACGGTRTVENDYWVCARSHSLDGATMGSEADAMGAQVHPSRFVPDRSDQQYHQNRGPGTYCSNTASHLTVLVGPIGEHDPVETVRKRRCHTFVG